MGFFSAYINGINNYTNFRDRASRKQYWMFVLNNLIIAMVIGFIGGILTSITKVPFNFILVGIYFLFMLIPSLAYIVRRLHDTNRSGGWFFIYFVPLIGGLWLLILEVLPGTEGSNTYGEDPREVK